MALLQTLWRNFFASLELVTAFAAFFLVLELGHRKARQYAQFSDDLKGLDAWIIAGVLAGSRISSMIPEAVANLGSLVNVYNLNFGLSLYGGIGGGAVALALYGRRRWKLTVALADVFSLYLALGIGLFHVGCLVYGFCGGKPAQFPLGLPLPGHVGLRYPSELYEGILTLGLFAVLLKLSQRGLPPGGVAGLFLFVYPLVRAMVNLTRFPTGAWPWADQVVSLSFAAVGVSILLSIWFRRRDRPASGESSKHDGRRDNAPAER